MARSFTNLNLVSSFLLNSLTRRGYAATSEVGVGGKKAAGRGGVGSSLKGNKSGGEEKVSWVPDPVTGYYKPENSKEMDVAGLRATLLGKKITN